MPVRARTTVVAASVVRCPAVDLERWRWRGAGCLPAPPPPVPAFKRVRPWRLSYATRQPPPPFVSRQFLQRGKGGASGSGTHPNHPQPRSLVRSGSRSVNHYPIALSPLTPSAAASFYCTTAWCRFYPRPTLHVPSFLLRLVPPRPSVPCSGSLTKMSPLTPFLSLSLSEFSLSPRFTLSVWAACARWTQGTRCHAKPRSRVWHHLTSHVPHLRACHPCQPTVERLVITKPLSRSPSPQAFPCLASHIAVRASSRGHSAAQLLFTMLLAS